MQVLNSSRLQKLCSFLQLKRVYLGLTEKFGKHRASRLYLMEESKWTTFRRGALRKVRNTYLSWNTGNLPWCKMQTRQRGWGFQGILAAQQGNNSRKSHDDKRVFVWNKRRFVADKWGFVANKCRYVAEKVHKQNKRKQNRTKRNIAFGNRRAIQLYLHGSPESPRPDRAAKESNQIRAEKAWARGLDRNVPKDSRERFSVR